MPFLVVVQSSSCVQSCWLQTRGNHARARRVPTSGSHVLNEIIVCHELNHEQTRCRAQSSFATLAQREPGYSIWHTQAWHTAADVNSKQDEQGTRREPNRRKRRCCTVHCAGCCSSCSAKFAVLRQGSLTQPGKVNELSSFEIAVAAREVQTSRLLPYLPPDGLIGSVAALPAAASSSSCCCARKTRVSFS